MSVGVCISASPRRAVIPAGNLRVELMNFYESQLAIFLRSEGHLWSVPGRRGVGDNRAFSVLELLIVVAIMMTLAAMGIPAFADAIDTAYVAQAIGDIRTLQTEITRLAVVMGKLPDSLDELGVSDLVDPWGRQYVYLNFANAAKDQHWGGSEEGEGKPRKDRFLVPINTTYDLYSIGEDGETDEDLLADKSQDDVVRANDGSFVGLASQY